ncbi:MAG: hypothetical protein CM15mP120_12370 [Pseudomonadota bacterium]|nr:MAG: hypothetical protein CM15mP120_12370 [Pseudomonadota bacterium]
MPEPAPCGWRWQSRVGAEVSQESESVAQAALAHALRGFKSATHYGAARLHRIFPVFEKDSQRYIVMNTLIVTLRKTTAKQVVAEMQRLELLSADTGAEGDITFSHRRC